MLTATNTLCLLFDGITLYIYFQIMFEQRKEKVPFFLVITSFILTELLFGVITTPFAGNVSYWAAIFRTMLTNVFDFLLSLFFYSGIVYRLFVVISFSITISICEELAYYLLSHFTDTSIVFDSLSEMAFTSIHLISNLFLLLFIMIVHVIRRQKDNVKSKKYTFLLLLIPFLSCILVMLPSFFDMAKINPNAYLVLVLFLLIINIVNYILLQSVLKAEALEQETRQLTQQIDYQRQKYQQLGDAYKNVRSFMHDTKKHLFYIETCVNEQKYDSIIPYTRETMTDLESRYCTVNTGNLVIDAFVSNLLLQAKTHGINFIHNLRVDKDRIPCDDYHMTIMLGNLLDNALNACLEEHGGEINLTIQTVEQTFMIYITNTYHFPPGKKRPASFENIDFIHGYGLKNVKISAEACGGFCMINYTEGLYSVTVIVPQRDTTNPALP